MIFVIDVGNTNMTMGVFQGKKMEATFRIMTKTPRTSDEYGIMITQLLKNNGIEVTDIEIGRAPRLNSSHLEQSRMPSSA